MLRLLLQTLVLGASEHISTLFTLKISPDRLLARLLARRYFLGFGGVEWKVS